MRERVGTFRYRVEVGDRERTRFEPVDAWVDTAALYSQFPASVLARLGHVADASRRFRLADGSVTELMIGEAPIRIGDEVRTVTCVFAEETGEVLLGATTLEAFSLAPNPVNETLEPIVAMMLALGSGESRA